MDILAKVYIIIIMKTYEMMTISDVSLGEDGALKNLNSVKDLITSFKGKTLDSNSWGKRKFAYELGHKTEGFYDVIKFQMTSSDVKSLKTKLNYMDKLSRYLITAA